MIPVSKRRGSSIASTLLSIGWERLRLFGFDRLTFGSCAAKAAGLGAAATDGSLLPIQGLPTSLGKLAQRPAHLPRLFVLISEAFMGPPGSSIT